MTFLKLSIFKKKWRSEPNEKKKKESDWKVSRGRAYLGQSRSPTQSSLLTSEAQKPIWEREAAPAETAPENTEEKDKDGKKKKKKKKKSKPEIKALQKIPEMSGFYEVQFLKSEKKKNKNEPPPVGPFVVKLHLADNAIDIYEDGTDKVKSLKVIHDAIETFVKYVATNLFLFPLPFDFLSFFKSNKQFHRLIKFSREVQEVDLHNNAIGNMGAKMLLNALEYRKLSKRKKRPLRKQ